jgi:DNA-binding transcriptional LysR family regulator
VSDVEALQICLAAEHAACYGYGALGGRLAGLTPGGSRLVAHAEDSYAAHRAARDRLAALVEGLGEVAVVAEPAYALPFTLDTVARCERLARYLEDRVCEAYAYAVSLSAGEVRAELAAALSAAAVRGASWEAPFEAFPGRPDL